MSRWLLPAAAGLAAGALLFLRYRAAAKRKNLELITQRMAQKLEDSETTGAIISFFADNGMFTSLSARETADILARDDEDGEKLAAGIRMAVAKKVLAPNPPVEALTLIPVLGKSADAVADAIIASLGDAPKRGCILVLQGLSGTGKGTTVAKLQATLPKCVSWSNGNVFRSLTLLAVTK